jgi:hypothetical protein
MVFVNTPYLYRVEHPDGTSIWFGRDYKSAAKHVWVSQGILVEYDGEGKETGRSSHPDVLIPW